MSNYRIIKLSDEKYVICKGVIFKLYKVTRFGNIWVSADNAQFEECKYDTIDAAKIDMNRLNIDPRRFKTVGGQHNRFMIAAVISSLINNFKLVRFDDEDGSYGITRGYISKEFFDFAICGWKESASTYCKATTLTEALDMLMKLKFGRVRENIFVRFN